ncbi:MAG: winged helix DNA-binding domain-containing protein [Anaerolineales bacterium]
MNNIDIASLRLFSQRIAATEFASPGQLVAWMGAMQAQDFAMVKWAVGVRLHNATDTSVQSAIDQADIIRTHVLRPTWHLVSADDIYWMLDLTAPQIKRGMKTRQNELGLTESVLSKSRKVIEKMLRDGNNSTREELSVALNKAGIATDENRASHIFVAAELESLICSGALKGGKQTFSLLNERVPQIRRLGREEALESLAKRYFSSHGPATLDDFSWWSGLSAGEAKRALDMVKSELSSAIVDAKTYWFAEANMKPKESVFLLPAFDEFIISYRDRSAVITSENHKRAVSSNGIFHPVVVVNGQVVGVWKRAFKKEKVLVELKPFAKLTNASQKLVKSALVQYGGFLGLEAQLTTI